jgi:hypothetical protein
MGIIQADTGIVWNAKTRHTFQRQSAGPELTILCIIIQPGSSKMEKQ